MHKSSKWKYSTDSASSSGTDCYSRDCYKYVNKYYTHIYHYNSTLPIIVHSLYIAL